MISVIVLLKIDLESLQTNTGEFTLILGMQVVSVYSYNEPMTYVFLHLRVAVNNHVLPF